ncbi:MAG: N-acetylneuraminate synthase [Thermoplasmata archaeon]|nr:N-acetylneuraminate synthase [Thermoplasmata archaeon]
MAKIKISDKMVGDDEPCFIIAEAGVNHNGKVELAKDLIDIAIEAGADAVKFQTFKTDSTISQNAEKAEYQKETTGKGSQYDMVKKLELTEKDFQTLAEYAKDKGIIFLSTPYDKESVDILEHLDIPAFKIGSGEITNFPLLRYIAEKRKPIIISTGMAVLEEVEEAIQILKVGGAEDIVILHCITSYPAKMEELNLRVITTLKNSFDCIVGYSDHSRGIYAPIIAVALGACVIEKHFTLDNNMLGPDHRASLEPVELKQMVDAIRTTELSLGHEIKEPTLEEIGIKKVARRSIVARIDISKGTVFTEDVLDVKRPGTGLSPKHMDEIIGKVAKKDIKRDELILMDDVEW